MIRNYFNEKAEIWDHKFAEKDRSKLEAIVNKFDIRHNPIMLDIGTGTGVLIPYLLPILGEGSIVAIDIAEKMLEKSREKLLDKRISHVQADVMNAPFKEGTFDAVICYSVFPHFTDKKSALGEIHRILTGGGHLYVAHSSGRQFINSIHGSIPGMQDHLLPDPVDMYALLDSCGFTGIEIEDRQESYFTKALKKSD
jgi:ubiquinone/menaquinone biosynthesis C-methylase UbiE